MNKTKLTLLTGFALFSLFFGAGNIILPPYLGYIAADGWMAVALGFVITAVIIPIAGIWAHARLQGSMLDFANRVSPAFSIVFCSLVYLVAITLPSPRTASLTHEMAVAPYSDWSSLTTSTIYFGLVFLFAVFRSRILELTGKVLTPILLIILLIIIVLITGSDLNMANATHDTGITAGILEGYQTFDAMGAVVVGAVLIISLKMTTSLDYKTRKKVILRSGILAGTGLCLVYGGLMYSGALLSGSLEPNLERSEVLNQTITYALGRQGHFILAGLISLACFTTTVGIIAGTADYVKGLIPHKHTYLVTAALGSIAGVLIGQLPFDTIISLAVPVLLFIYPLIIVFILLNSLPQKWMSDSVFKAVSFTVMLLVIPDVLGHFGVERPSAFLRQWLPGILGSFPWFAGALFVFLSLQLTKNRLRK